MTTVTLDLDDDVVRALDAEAARSGRPSHEIVSALVRRHYVRGSVLDELWAKADLTEDEAMEIAVEETRAAREEMRQQRDTDG